MRSKKRCNPRVMFRCFSFEVPCPEGYEEDYELQDDAKLKKIKNDEEESEEDEHEEDQEDEKDEDFDV